MPIRLAITDVTRMHGSFVCIAGVDNNWQSVRPVFAYGQIPEEWLYDKNGPVIHPFSVVKFEVLIPRPHPPHTEDLVVGNIKRKTGELTNEGKKRVLTASASENVEQIFEAEILHHPGSYVREGEGIRSLGTVKVKVVDFFYGVSFDSWDYRITFMDCANQSYSLKVTELSLRYYCDFLRDKEGLSPDTISRNLKRHLMKSEVFLRIGLTRPTWQKHPHCCFLQINGVYTFPDYLDGRCFADFKRP